ELGTARQLQCRLTERDNLNEVRLLLNHPDALLDVPERTYFSCVSNDRLMRTGVSVECVQIEKVIEDIGSSSGDLYRREIDTHVKVAKLASIGCNFGQRFFR